MKYKIISLLKNGQITGMLIYVFFIICPNILAQDIVNNNINEEWAEEYARIAEQAENWRTEQQARILTLSDLEFTYWEADGAVKEISWNFAFFNKNQVLLLNSNTMFPYLLIQYSIIDNVIFFTEILKGYLADTYLFIGNERMGYAKFKLQYVFSRADAGVTGTKIKEKRQVQ